MINVRSKKKTLIFIKPNKIPSYLIVFCFINQFLLGIDFGFGSLITKRIRVIAQIYTLTLSLIIILILGVPLIFAYYYIVLWLSFIEYTSYFIALSKVKNKFFNFVSDMNNINKLSANESVILFCMVVVYTIVTLSIKVVFLVLRCTLASQTECVVFPLLFYIAYTIPCLGIEGTAIVQAVIPYYIYCYVKGLKNYVKKTNGNDLKILERHYKVIADCFDNVWPFMSHLTFIELFIGVPRLMMTLWFMLHYIRDDYSWYSYVTEYVFASQMITQICCPAIITEMISSQMDAIKAVLNEKLLVEKDPGKEAEILRMLRYLQARKLRRKVLRFIPIDLRQLISLCTLCTTYFIIIVQFTHLDS